MTERKEQMREFLRNFDGMPDRLLKYMEILLLGKDASPYSYQDTMSYRRLAVAVTTYCNLQCKWCYRFDSHFKDILNKNMDLDVFEKIIRNTVGRLRLIHLAGTGEVLLYPHLLDAIKIAREKSEHVKITTNGTLLTPVKIEALVGAGLTHIEFSIDAFSLDKLTDYRGADLRQIVDIVTYISNTTGLFLQINAVVADLNYEYLFNIVDVLKGAKNIKVIHTIPLFMTEQLHSSNVGRVSDEKYRALLEKIENDIKANNLAWKLHPSAHGVGFDPVIEMKRRKNICFSCFEDPYIDTDGYLTACGRREFEPIADAAEGLEKAMNSPGAVEFRRKMLNGEFDDFCSRLCYLKKKEKS